MRLCTHPGCTRQHTAKGFCFLHYQRDKKGTPMDAPFRVISPRGTNAGKRCGIASCGRKAARAGLCQAHGRRQVESPGAWSSPIQPRKPPRGAGARVSEFWAPIEHLRAVEEEAKERGAGQRFGTLKADVLREALAEWVERRAEKKRQEALAEDLFGDQRRSPLRRRA